jgi:PAS domain S-box-containing protein
MISRRLHRIAWMCGVIVLVIGLMTIAGWIFRVDVLTSLLPGFVSMKMNAAICFAVAGTSLLLQTTPRSPQHSRRPARICGSVVAVIGCATLVEYIAGVDLHIDQLIMRAPQAEIHTAFPGRMASLSGIGFTLAGLALATLDAESRALRVASQITAFIVLLIGFVTAAAYLLGATAFYAIAGLTAMAIHTALAFAVLATGILLSRPRRGIIEVLAQTNPAGAGIRRMLVQSVLALAAIGWLRVTGQRAGFYGAELGALLALSGSTIGIVVVVLWNAAIQRSSEASRLQSRLDERLLFELGDLLRTTAQSDDVLVQVSVKLGEYLDVSRCLFVESNRPDGRATIRSDYHAGVRSLTCTALPSSWSSIDVGAELAGKTIVNSDASVDERTAGHYESTFRPLDVRSYIAVPMLRNGRCVSTLIASTHHPRSWHPREIVLVQAVAERAWLWFEHLVVLEALSAREQHLAGVLDAAFDAIVSTDAAGTIVELNRAAEQTLGYRRIEVMGKPFVDVLVPPLHRNAHRVAFAQSLERADPSAQEKPIQLPVMRPDGTEIATEIAVTRVQGSGPPRFTVFIRDVTERKRAMDQLLLAIEAAPTGMILVDHDGNIALVNAQLESMFGYPREMLVSQPVELLVPEPSRGRHPQLRQAFLGDPRFHTMGAGRELFGLHRDGRQIPISIALNPFHNENGEFVLASVVDITERKHAEQALRESEERLRLAQQNARVGTFEWNIETDVITWTEQMEAVYGLQVGAFPRTASGWERLIHPGDRERVGRTMERALENDAVTEGEWRIVWPDGTIRWLTGRWKVFRDPTGKPVRASGINIDVTERKLAEQEREDLLGQLGALNEELEQRVRDRTSQLTAALKEREVLLQEVHHRVKNNLQIISSLIKLQARKIDNVGNRSGLEECRQRVETIALIHEQLYQAKDYAQVPFSDYVKRLVGNVFQATSLSHPLVTLAIDVENILLPVDRAIPCGLILNELVTNALKHAFPGNRPGAIRIELKQSGNDEVVLAVRDDGVGASHGAPPAAARSLGMRLIQMLVQQIHGRLEVVDSDGMTFRITFPLSDGVAPS